MKCIYVMLYINLFGIYFVYIVHYIVNYQTVKKILNLRASFHTKHPFQFKKTLDNANKSRYVVTVASHLKAN